MHNGRLKRRVLSLALVFVFLATFAAAVKGNYLAQGQLDLVRVLAPAPAPDSATTKADLAELLVLQKERTPAQEEAAEADVKRSPFRFAGVLGPKFTQDSLPLTDALFKAAAKDASLAVGQVKNHWNRPRPFALSDEIKPSLHKPASPSYPSGHATYGHLAAIILAAMVPEKAGELFHRGEVFARQRVIGGVHYPSDVEAGRIAAAVIASALFQNEEFKADFEKAKKEVRTALGLE